MNICVIDKNQKLINKHKNKEKSFLGYTQNEKRISAEGTGRGHL